MNANVISIMNTAIINNMNAPMIGHKKVTSKKNVTISDGSHSFKSKFMNKCAINSVIIDKANPMPKYVNIISVLSLPCVQM